jgi:hypothetical protein
MRLRNCITRSKSTVPIWGSWNWYASTSPVLSLAPLIGLPLESLVAFMIDGSGAAGAAAIDNNKYWYITLALNIGLSYFDEKGLQQAGWDTSKFKVMTWLVPVYLFKCAKALNQSLPYFIVWLVCFAIAMVSRCTDLAHLPQLQRQFCNHPQIENSSDLHHPCETGETRSRVWAHPP